MIAVGIDVGGTKIEAQIFDANWTCVDLRRVETPKTYDAIVAQIAALVQWADETASVTLPVGVGSAGRVNPQTGLTYGANLPITGKPFPADIAQAVERPITYMNDCRALLLSEVTFGVGRGAALVAGLILGTGVGGGLALNGQLLPIYSGVGGEFGHFSASAHLISKYDLPIIRCGCGRDGCSETLVSGPGLTRIARHVSGLDMSAEVLAVEKASNPEAAKVWKIWCDLLADLLMTVVFNSDPEMIVIGGGLSKIPNLARDVSAALQRAQLPGFSIPHLAIASGGDASGARGTAYAAVQDHGAKVRGQAADAN